MDTVNRAALAGLSPQRRPLVDLTVSVAARLPALDAGRVEF
jgi:hypothetical protein